MKVRFGGLFGSSSFESTPMPMYEERRSSGRERVLRDELDRTADQRDDAWDLLRRIRASMEDGSFEVPDVWHGIEAEITELIGP